MADAVSEAAVALGAMIQRARKAKQLTQAELADAIEQTPNNVSRIERGLVVPTRGARKRIAKVLGLPPAALDEAARAATVVPMLPASVVQIDRDDLEPYKAVRETPAYRAASPNARAAYDQWRPFTSTGESRDQRWTRCMDKLIGFIRDDAMGQLAPAPVDAIEVEVDDEDDGGPEND